MNAAESDHIARMLVELLAAAAPSEIPASCFDMPESDFDELLEAAKHHRVTPLLELALRNCPNLPAAFSARLRDICRAVTVVHIVATDTLRRLGNAFDDLGVDWATFKGPLLAETSYRRPGSRPFSDLDIIVRPGHLARAVRHLFDIGSRVAGESWESIQQAGIAQMTFQLPNGLALDLHWHLFSLPWARAAFPVDTNGLLDRRRQHSLSNGAKIYGLDPADKLIHLCTHAALSGGSRLIWLKDIEQTLKNDPADWDMYIYRAKKTRQGLPVAVMLQRTRTTLNAQVPQQLLNSLAPPLGWRTVSHAIDVLRPPERSRFGSLTGDLLIRSTRDTSVASVRSLSRGLLSGGLLPLVRDPNHPWRRRLHHLPPDASQYSVPVLDHSADEQRRMVEAIASGRLDAG